MSLKQAGAVYYALIAVLAILLVSIGALLDWIAAGALIVAAPLLFRIICQASADATLNDVERRRASRREMSVDETKDSGSSGTPFATLR